MTDIDEIFAKGERHGSAACGPRPEESFAISASPATTGPTFALMEAIHRYAFDTILMAVNAADPHHYSFSEQLLPLAVEKQMGIDRDESPSARSRILSSWTPLRRQQRSSRNIPGKGWRSDADGGHARYAAGNVLLAFASGKHGDHRLRFDCAARRERQPGARVHTVEPATDGGALTEKGAASG